MISRADVVDGYTWILGRVPPAEEIEAARRCYASPGIDDRHAFQHSLLISEEFRLRRIHVQQQMRVAPVDLSRPKLIFLHIEKCGGTTMRAMLASQVASDRVCPERFNGLPDWTANELAAYDLFAGHFDLSSCHVVPGERNATFTMLREPKARLRSLFHFWKAHRPHPSVGERTLVGLARACTEIEFFSHRSVVRHPSIRDALTAQLIRPTGRACVEDYFFILTDDDLILAAPEQCLDLAWAKLQALAGFGLVEHFDLSRRLLNARLGLCMAPIEPLQVLRYLDSTMLEAARVPPAPADDRLDGLLDSLTGIDRALYARAVDLFRNRTGMLVP